MIWWFKAGVEGKSFYRIISDYEWGNFLLLLEKRYLISKVIFDESKYNKIYSQ